MTTSYVELGAFTDYVAFGTSSFAATGTCTVSGGDIGNMGTATTGFPPSTLSDGVFVSTGDSTSDLPDLSTAIDEIASRTSVNLIPAEIGGSVYTPGLYHSTGAVTCATDITLDGFGNYVFQINAALSLSASVSVILSNGATSDSIFWQVTGAFSTGANSNFAGTVLGSAAIGVGSGSIVDGRLFTELGAFTMTSSQISFSYSAAYLAALAAEVKADLISSTVLSSTFDIEIPDGTISTVIVSWGDSCDDIVSNLINLYSLSTGYGNIWRIFYGEVEVTDATIQALIESDPNFNLRPMAKWLGNWERIGGNDGFIVTLQTKTKNVDLNVNGTFTSRFYQREVYTWLNLTGDNQVWIDSTDSFIDPSSLMSSIPSGSILRLVELDESTFENSQLPS